MNRLCWIRVLPQIDPLLNLAQEEHWFESVTPGSYGLILYRNDACVVMGKHQNPLREIRLEDLWTDNRPWFRRCSGGGTVWHDPGNLNYAIVCDRALYDQQQVHQTLVQALASLGRKVTLTEKGDLLWNEKKISGTAYAFRKDRVLHHGTLLCQANLTDLRRYLGPTGTLVRWTGVASRPMSVTNLDLVPEVVMTAVIQAFGQTMNSLQPIVPTHDWDAISPESALVKRLSATDWRWNQTPAFTWSGSTRHGELTVSVAEGLVIDCPQKPDCVGQAFFSSVFFENFKA